MGGLDSPCTKISLETGWTSMNRGVALYDVHLRGNCIFTNRLDDWLQSSDLFSLGSGPDTGFYRC